MNISGKLNVVIVETRTDEFDREQPPHYFPCSYKHQENQRINQKCLVPLSIWEQLTCCRKMRWDKMRCSGRSCSSLGFTVLQRFWRQERKCPVPGQTDSARAPDRGRRTIHTRTQWQKSCQHPIAMSCQRSNDRRKLCWQLPHFTVSRSEQILNLFWC